MGLLPWPDAPVPLLPSEVSPRELVMKFRTPGRNDMVDHTRSTIRTMVEIMCQKEEVCFMFGTERQVLRGVLVGWLVVCLFVVSDRRLLQDADLKTRRFLHLVSGLQRRLPVHQRKLLEGQSPAQRNATTQPPYEDPHPRHSRPLECGVISTTKNLRHTHPADNTPGRGSRERAICEIGRGKKSNESQLTFT